MHDRITEDFNNMNETIYVDRLSCSADKLFKIELMYHWNNEFCTRLSNAKAITVFV